MSEAILTRQQVVDCLEDDWKTYVVSFERMDLNLQEAVLSRQGYSSFHDMLAHICGWWEECLAIVTSIMENEEIPNREYDVDVFNAESIARFSTWTDDDLYSHFENLRNGLIDIVSDLPDGPMENRRIALWLDACVVNHFHEHRL